MFDNNQHISITCEIVVSRPKAKARLFADRKWPFLIIISIRLKPLLVFPDCRSFRHSGAFSYGTFYSTN